MLFAALGIAVKQGAAEGPDGALLAAAANLRQPVLNNIIIFITRIGEWYVYVPVLALLLIIPRTRMKFALPTAIIMSVGGLLNVLLKALFAVNRPDGVHLVFETSYGFPSGHAMMAAVFFGFAAYLLRRILKGRYFGAICAAAAVIILLIGFSRIYLGVHSPTDILGGYLVAAAVVLVGSVVSERMYGMGKRLYGI